MSELNFNELKEKDVPPVIEGSAWEGNVGMALEPKWFPKLSVRAGHVLFDGLKAKTFGDLLKLDAKTIAEAKNSGKKIKTPRLANGLVPLSPDGKYDIITA